MKVLKLIFKPIYEILKKSYIFLILLFIYCASSFIFHFPACFSKLIFGLPCPGCGMTRAGLSILTGNFSKALYYNPGIFILPVVMILIIYKDYKYIAPIYKSKIVWIMILVFILGIFIFRMIMLFPYEPLDINEYGLLQLIIGRFK